MGIKIEQLEKKERITKIGFEKILRKEIILFGDGFAGKKKEQFYSELSVLLKSGITLKYSLDIITESQKKEKDQEKIRKIALSLVNGISFAQALSCDKSFTPYECEAIRIGETTGQLSFITEDLAQYFKRKNTQKRQIISALTYPIIVLITAMVVVFFMLNYVVPMFGDIFKQNHVDLPFLTKLIVKLSHFLKSRGNYIFLGILLLAIVYRMAKDKVWFRKYSGNFLLKIPILGEYIKKIYLTRFTHTMMLMSNAKIPVINGLAMVRKMIDFYPLQKGLLVVEEDILQGEKMSTSFSHHKIFDKKIIALLKVAEETNQTEYIFAKLFDQYSVEVEYQSQTITNILNPLLTLMVGVIVGVILISMYLPMFKLSTVIGN